MVQRFSTNPLIVPQDVAPSLPELEVLCAFNPAATEFNGRRLLLVRIAERPKQEEASLSTVVFDAETGAMNVLRFRLGDPDLNASDPRLIVYRGTNYLTSLSHLRVAISDDGRNFHIGSRPALSGTGPYETFGIEDPRIVRFGDDYLVTYTAVSGFGVVSAMARTRDFENFEKLGVIFGPDNKDIAIFPEQIDGRYFTLHRPAVRHLGCLCIWLASSDNLLDWGGHRAIISPRPGRWDSERVGAGSPPVRTADGWLVLYHGSDFSTRYCIGALLLDLEKPWQVLARSEEPFLVPEAPYEREGFIPDVIFQSGCIDNRDGTLDLFYGAGDLCTAGCTVAIQDILSTLKPAA